MVDIKKHKKLNFKEIFIKSLKISVEIFIIQVAITLVLGLLAIMFYNFQRIGIISLIPGLIGAIIIGKKYVRKQEKPLEKNTRLFASIILAILNIIIFYIFIDKYLSYNPSLFLLIIVLEIIFGAMIYWILGLIKK